ncbi:hypothetical protein M405DRAFT_935566 [Rhizopogon salebrosus TDB-379]|nr:hypothetical protein M405DRAFT_935566 [Rhizopogon salebrosus TDB-379]
MSIPLPGTYRIRSVKFPNQLFDLQGGSGTPGTPVVGFGNNTGSQNMLWTVQVVDAANKTVRMIDVASGTFAQSSSPQKLNAGVVGSPGAALFNIVPRPSLGEYSIQTTDGKWACSLISGNNGTQVILHLVNNNETDQGWIFCPV